MAPATCGGEVELQQAAKPGSAWNHACDRAADRADGTGESELGLHADSRCARQSEPHGGSGDGSQCTEGERNRTCARTRQAHPVVGLPESALEGIGRE
jgi:hypothetical protein